MYIFALIQCLIILNKLKCVPTCSHVNEPIHKLQKFNYPAPRKSDLPQFFSGVSVRLSMPCPLPKTHFDKKNRSNFFFAKRQLFLPPVRRRRISRMWRFFFPSSRKQQQQPKSLFRRDSGGKGGRVPGQGGPGACRRACRALTQSWNIKEDGQRSVERATAAAPPPSSSSSPATSP
jgi:hypothetical protein